MSKRVIQTKSVYDPQAKSDGYRIVVVNQWPAGLQRGKASGVDWMKSLGPGEGLRKWMAKNPRKVGTFTDKYLAELAHNDAAIEKISAMHAKYGTITVLSVPAFDQYFPIADTVTRFLAATCDLD